jgi:hypothetical protein
LQAFHPLRQLGFLIGLLAQLEQLPPQTVADRRRMA